MVSKEHNTAKRLDAEFYNKCFLNLYPYYILGLHK